MIKALNKTSTITIIIIVGVIDLFVVARIGADGGQAGTAPYWAVAVCPFTSQLLPLPLPKFSQRRGKACCSSARTIRRHAARAAYHARAASTAIISDEHSAGRQCTRSAYYGRL